MSAAIEVVACTVCASEDWEQVSPAEMGLRSCRACGLVFAGLVGDPAVVYDDDYLSSCSSFGPDTTNPLIEAIGRMAARRRLSILAEITGVNRGSFLDVGCGSGEALLEADAVGWRVTGVEPVRTSAERARLRGFEVLTGTLDGLDPESRSHDVVHASHVLEHMLDPVGLLRSMAAHVRPGGHVVVEVPNWDHPAREQQGVDWEMLCPLEHVNHFTPATLRSAFVRADLDPVVRTTTITGSSPDLDRNGRGFAIVAIAAVA